MAKETEKKTNAPSPSMRDNVRNRIAGRNADLNMEDEEAYYGAANSALDELDQYETGVRNLRSVMDSNPSFARMLAAASKQSDLDPVTYLIENGELDPDALINDKEYSKKVAKAQAKWKEKKAKRDAQDKAFDENFPASVDACIARGEQLGLSKEQSVEVIGKVFGMMDELDEGRINMDVFDLMAKGAGYDKAVSDAAAQGEANGRAARVREKLREMPRQSERAGGVQERAAEPQPVKKERNMFGI